MSFLIYENLKMFKHKCMNKINKRAVLTLEKKIVKLYSIRGPS